MIVFSLWYWDLDAGGPAARAAGRTGATPSFLFPEAAVPELTGPGWYPHFVDYLALSFNTSLAFGPSDVSPIRRWAKFLVIMQSMISLALAALVLALRHQPPVSALPPGRPANTPTPPPAAARVGAVRRGCQGAKLLYGPPIRS